MKLIDPKRGHFDDLPPEEQDCEIAAKQVVDFTTLYGHDYVQKLLEFNKKYELSKKGRPLDFFPPKDGFRGSVSYPDGTYREI